MSRLNDLDRRFDALIVGGGIIGAGIARDAARRGLYVALFERNDYGSGTTAGSTRLIHGGLRYLEMLDFRLVRMDLRERETLLRIAPHLVRPLEFLMPLYGRSLFHRAKLRAGMSLYDLLSYDKSIPGRRFLSAEEVRQTEPLLNPEGLQGAAAFYDVQANSPERLCLENVLDARAHGAVALNYVEVTGAGKSGLRVRDTLSGEERDVRGRVTVNATGPWFDRVAVRLGPHPRRLIRTTKGIHLACDPIARKAHALFSRLDGRLVFAIPFLGYTWVGTTDTDFADDPGEARATSEDVEYLRRSLAGFFPPLTVRWTNAGVRALVTHKGSESSVSRLHRLQRTRPGLISVLGGKITGYRAIAEEATDLVCRELRHSARCTTAKKVLPAPPTHHDLEAEVRHAARYEQCMTVSDFLLRRTLRGFEPGRSLDCLPAVAAVLSDELGWTAARARDEVESCRNHVRQTETF